MENPRFRAAAVCLSTKPYSTDNDTEDLDDTLPIELLDCVETTTNEDWLTRDIRIRDKVTCVTDGESSVFNPPLCSTRLKSDGLSTEFALGSWSSVTAEYGSSELGRSGLKIPRDDSLVPPLMPAASMDFQPLRCSTAVTANDIRPMSQPPLMPSASMEFQPLRCSTAVTASNVRPMAQPSLTSTTASMEFQTANTVPASAVGVFEIRCDTRELEPLPHSIDADDGTEKRKSSAQHKGNPAKKSARIVGVTGFTTPNIPPSPETEARPSSPEEYFSANGSSNVNMLSYDNLTHFETARSNFAVANSGSRTEQGKFDELKSPEILEAPAKKENSCENVDSGLSIMMQCHLKIRSGGKVISDFTTKPQFDFSVFKDSLSAVALSAEKMVQAKFPPIMTENKVQNPAKNTMTQRGVDTADCNGLRLEGKNGDKLVSSPEQRHLLQSAMPAPHSAKRIPTWVPTKPGYGTQAHQKEDIRRSEHNHGTGVRTGTERHHYAKVDNRLQSALDGLASPNIQKMVAALASLDSARSDLLCETIVELGLVDRIYDFFSKMNRSVAHQVACVHATSLLLDLAKYSYSTESAWQNGSRIGLILNLMSIWVSKDNAIFLNCASILWIFSRDEVRANIVRRSAGPQQKLLEKMSVKLNTRLTRFAGNAKTPALKPSWTNAGVRRTFENPATAFNSLCGVFQNPQIRIK